MARRVPGVRQRGDKWIAEAYDPKAAKKVRLGTFDSQDDAIDEKERFERQKHKPRARKWTCDEFVELWTTTDSYTAGRAPSTIRHNKERTKLFAEDFKGVLLTDVDRPRAREWGVAHPQHVPAVRAMFTDAHNDGLVPNNPFAGLKISRGRGRKDIIVFTEGEIRRLVQVATANYQEEDGSAGWGTVMAGLVTTAAYAGLRLGELCGLQWKDIDWQAGRITVDRQWRSKERHYSLPKGKQARTVVMLEPVAETLRQIPHLAVDDDLVFYTKRDCKRYTERAHNYYWTPVRSAFWATLAPDRRAQIPSTFDFHELRHFCGSFFADLGATAQDIALQLGHQDGGRLAQDLYIHTYADNALERLRSAYTNRPERQSA